MSSLAFAILTGSTCGDNCWHAREEICRCSCGGANHGCLLADGAEQPVRTAKIDGGRYQLAGIGTLRELHELALPLNQAEGITYVYAYSSRDFGDIPAKIRPANVAQI